MSIEGASPGARALAACRVGDLELLEDVLAEFNSFEQQIDLLNTAKNGLGQYCLHQAAQYGHPHIIDFLTNLEGLEVDEPDLIQGDTAIHKAIRYINGLSPDRWEDEDGNPMAQLLTSSDVDLKMKNKAGQKPIDLVDPRNQELRLWLLKEAFRMAEGQGLVDADAEEEQDSGGN